MAGLQFEPWVAQARAGSKRNGEVWLPSRSGFVAILVRKGSETNGGMLVGLKPKRAVGFGRPSVQTLGSPGPLGEGLWPVSSSSLGQRKREREVSKMEKFGCLPARVSVLSSPERERSQGRDVGGDQAEEGGGILQAHRN